MDSEILQALQSLGLDDPQVLEETANYIKEEVKEIFKEEVREQAKELMEQLFDKLSDKLGMRKEVLKPALEPVIIAALEYQATIAAGDPKAFGGQAEKDKVLKSAINQVEYFKAKATKALDAEDDK